MSKTLNLNPWFVTGFTDGEGCFSLSIIRNKELKIGWEVQLSFQIAVHKKELDLLEYIKNFFGVGNITKQRSESINYRVRSIKDLLVIISHFDKYPLLTQKYSDYQFFKQVIELIQSKEHLTVEGLRKIVAIKASMNFGLSEELKTAFPKIIPITRPMVVNKEIQDPCWFAGFTAGEGCFYVRISKNSNYNTGSQVILIFQLTQHSRDEQLMKSLIKYFNCGNVYKDREAVYFKITKFNDLTNKLIPFFDKYPILGVKYKDFKDFCKVVELMQNKEHLTAFGLDQIRKIKAGMNRGIK